MLTWLFIMIVCVVIGSVANYVGVDFIVEAFSHSGGDAIGLFCGGIVIAIIGVVCFVLVAMAGRMLFLEIKEHLK